MATPVGNARARARKEELTHSLRNISSYVTNPAFDGRIMFIMDSDPAVAKEGSAFGRMLNVLPSPGEVFQEIKERPVTHPNWLVPGVVWMIVGIVATLLLFSQDWAMYEIKKGQEKAVQQRVREGKMTQEQADQGMQFMEKFMPLFVRIAGMVATIIYAFGLPFFWGFVIWFLGNKIFKAEFEYMKGVEAAGLATIIYAISGLIGALVSLAMGKFVYLSAAFPLKEFDFTSKQHFALAAINPFYVWYIGVIALAISVFSGASWVKSFLCVFAIWVVTRALLIAINMGQFTM